MQAYRRGGTLAASRKGSDGGFTGAENAATLTVVNFCGVLFLFQHFHFAARVRLRANGYGYEQMGTAASKSRAAKGE